MPAEAETEWDQLRGRGQAREFAPIIELSSHTHSGQGVIMEMTPPALKDRKGFPAFREQVKVYAKFNCSESVLTTESPVDVGSEERDVLLRRGVSSVTCTMLCVPAYTHERRTYSATLYPLALPLVLFLLSRFAPSARRRAGVLPRALWRGGNFGVAVRFGTIGEEGSQENRWVHWWTQQSTQQQRA